MKSLAIIGMMLLSIGAFAQQSSNVEAVEKEKVCIKKGDQLKKNENLEASPHRHVTARKAPVRRGGVVVQKRQVQKAEVSDQKMIPLKRKSASTKAKR